MVQREAWPSVLVTSTPTLEWQQLATVLSRDTEAVPRVSLNSDKCHDTAEAPGQSVTCYQDWVITASSGHWTSAKLRPELGSWTRNPASQ